MIDVDLSAALFLLTRRTMENIFDEIRKSDEPESIGQQAQKKGFPSER